MNENLHYLQWCVADAHSDCQAEALLRAIVRGAADSAPVNDLAKIGQSLIDIYRDTARRHAEEN
jgi:hypothetical protein